MAGVVKEHVSQGSLRECTPEREGVGECGRRGPGEWVGECGRRRLGEGVGEDRECGRRRPGEWVREDGGGWEEETRELFLSLSSSSPKSLLRLQTSLPSAFRSWLASLPQTLCLQGQPYSA